MEITLPWAPIQALSHLAADNDLRKGIEGVWIDFGGPNVIVWATTGVQLGAYRTEEPSIDHGPVFVPKHIVKGAKGFGPQVTLRMDENKRCALECLGATHYWQDAGYTTLEWRRVLPKQCTGVTQQFDVSLLPAFLKARKALGKKDAPSAVRITHNGGAQDGPEGALVTLLGVPEFVGVLMPLRFGDNGSASKEAAPEWAFLRGRAPAQSADEPCDAAEDLV